MELGLHLPDFTWPGGPSAIAPTLAAIARDAEAAGFRRLSVMDHFWQLSGTPEREMLEAYTTLGFLAAHTSTITLATLVTGTTYREPGVLAKIISTLDVVSGGRAMLGIGAGWNVEESAGLGLNLPPTAERFERLEETVRIILRMWSTDESPFAGKHYRLARTLNSPQPPHTPRPRIMIGGGGERKTLRLVAQYADSCNFSAGPEVVAHKLAVLREHCDRLGRDYDSIEKTVGGALPLGADGAGVERFLDELRALHDVGVTVFMGALLGPAGPGLVEAYGERVIPEIATW